EESLREQIEDLVGAGATDDAARIKPERLADGFAQHAQSAFRIVLQMRADFLIGRDRLGRGPKRRLVGRQLEHLAAHLWHRALAWGGGRNVEDGGIRDGAVHLRDSRSNAAFTAWKPRWEAPCSGLHGCRREQRSARLPGSARAWSSPAPSRP